MNFPVSSFTRATGLLALLLVVLNLVCAGMSLHSGVWQKVLPVTVIASGLFLVFQLLGILGSGMSGQGPNLLWRLIAAHGFVVATFCLLVVLMPDRMWNTTKQDVAANPGAFTGRRPGVDARLRESVDLSGPLSPGTLFALNVLLMGVAFAASRVEDANPDLDPVV